jgi:hypothetical protein
MAVTQERTETIEERVARLTVRLEAGFTKIGEAMSHGIEVENWEQAWVNLLREYEKLSDELAAQPEPLRVQGQLGLAVARRPVERDVA